MDAKSKLSPSLAPNKQENLNKESMNLQVLLLERFESDGVVTKWNTYPIFNNILSISHKRSKLREVGISDFEHK